MDLEFERMFDNRDEWIAYVVGEDGRRSLVLARFQGDPRELADDDIVRFRTFAGREEMRWGDFRAALRPLVADTEEAIQAVFGPG